jgi:hypothetical protein
MRRDGIFSRSKKPRLAVDECSLSTLKITIKNTLQSNNDQNQHENAAQQPGGHHAG